ncbi:hypothetical protein DUNSADRAFT_16202 [Dunaliella salina]|uniref:Uncharacterized protein n=1 Tax=Dunaliella salina TaxID=3046 RepID=A0ABQ7G402_DUNSA|nr:hypothetical protein DUNSADRAFT_16202 [Dunaliella salina]|eukprot:KAF5829342.1 hypothetical protein DUNSADRAFT_16202 [Dunaliella salina]
MKYLANDHDVDRTGMLMQELRRIRHEQRRGQWRLAKKLKNTHNQLALMQRDRQSLVDAVTYTRVQATEMVVIITNVNNHFQRLQANHAEMLETEGFSMADLLFIENGLRNMAAMAKRVQEVNKEAEDQHFQTEEEVTAVIAADDVEDDEVDAIMAGGDPDKQDEPPPDLLAANEAKAAAEEEEKAMLEEERRTAEEQAEQEEQERAEAEAVQKEQEAAAAAEKAAAEKAASEQAAAEQAVAETAAAEQAAAAEQPAADAAASTADASGPPGRSGETTEEEAPKQSPSPSRASSARPSELVRQKVGSSQPSSSRASSKAASVQDAGMQTLPIQPSPQEIKQEERRIQDLLRGRERKLAERLMETFDIEMDRDLLQAKRAAASPLSASPMPSPGASRSASPDKDRRSPHARSRGAVDRSRMGRMHASEEEDPGSARRPSSSPSPGSASSPNQEQSSFLEMVWTRIRDKMEDLQDGRLAGERKDMVEHDSWRWFWKELEARWKTCR